PNLKIKDILPPVNPQSPVYINGKTDVALVRNRANRVYVHPTTYEVLKVYKANAANTVTWLNDIADPLHFGYFGGLLTKLIWFFGGLGISFLVGTGIWISLKRKVKDAQKARAQKLGKWKYPNLIVVGLLFVFMYGILFGLYSINWYQFTWITLFWIILIGLTWWIYVKKINKQVIHTPAADH
ncbi:MAG: PepSY domain-containing protein, partial [Bacteroidota bacterium]